MRATLFKPVSTHKSIQKMNTRRFLLQGVRFAFEGLWLTPTNDSLDMFNELTATLTGMGGVFCDEGAQLVFHKSREFRIVEQDGSFTCDNKLVACDEDVLHVTEDWLYQVLLPHERGLLPMFKDKDDAFLAVEYSPRALRWAQTFLQRTYVFALENLVTTRQVDAAPSASSAGSRKRQHVPDTMSETSAPAKRPNQDELPSNITPEILEELMACYSRYRAGAEVPLLPEDTVPPTRELDKIFRFFRTSPALISFWGEARFPVAATFSRRYIPHLQRIYNKQNGASQSTQPTQDSEDII
jgi:hypothetical protein